MIRRWMVALLLLLWLAPSAKADEGMWLLPYLAKLNIKDMKAKGLKLSAEDIYSINRMALKDAIVIFGGGCTGEVVSDRGLVLTNHHCGYGAIQQQSTVEHDYLKHGFWAMSDQEEIPSPGLTVTFIRKIEDVSQEVLAEVTAQMSEAQRTEAITAAMGRVQQKVLPLPAGQQVEIKAFFGGNQYLMFIKEVFSDIRLVGAPPSSIGKFGGDTDNWMWPRHTGDFSVFRIYADAEGHPASYAPSNVPYQAPKHLKISLQGYKPGDYTMIIGFPGSTERYKTSYAVDYTLNLENPTRILIRGERQELMMDEMLKSDRTRIQYASKYSSSSNYWKNAIGESRGLIRQRIMERTEEQQQQFTKWLEADPARKAQYQEALPLIQRAFQGGEFYNRMVLYYSEALLRSVELLQAAQIGKRMFQPDSLQGWRVDSTQIAMVRAALTSFYKDYDGSLDRKITRRMFHILQDSLTPEALPSSFKVIQEYYGGSVDSYVDHLFDRSIWADSARAMRFMEHPEVVQFMNDPMIQFNQSLQEKIKALNDSMQTYQMDFQRGHRLYIAGLRAMNPQKKYYPDANFTMRLTYGTVQPYQPQDGVSYHYYTTLDGVMEKEDPTNLYEFEVPEALKVSYRKGDFGSYAVKGKIPVNFITTNDITGGNSGSPVMNRRGELIGLAFDGNWEAMSGDTVFEPELQRTICVDIRYVLFVIDKMAGDTRLIQEMTIVK